MLVVRDDCADCDTPAADPEVVGRLDPLTGTFTPGGATGRADRRERRTIYVRSASGM